MRIYILIIITILCILISACRKKNKYEEKGFQVQPSSENPISDTLNQLVSDSLLFETQPGSVLLTGITPIRLTPIYKVTINKKNQNRYNGSNNFHYTFNDEDDENNKWNNNLIPGIQAVYGYNMINVSLYDNLIDSSFQLFEKPVLIKTLYYPSFTKDTLNGKSVKRNYILVSVYNDDTNKDSFINLKDVRRFYLFDMHGKRQKALLPENYSVYKSEYDSDNDYMYAYAKLDANGNGQIEENEPIHIFWIDLKDPTKSGRQY